MSARIHWSEFTWAREGRRLLDVPDLDVSGPGLVLVLGATGSGKTTLLRSATHDPGLEDAGTLGGRVDVEAASSGDGPSAGFLPQSALDGFLGFDPETEFVLRERAQGAPLARARLSADERLAGIGLVDRRRVPIERLSGGERKRLALAAARVGRPPILLLDEPLNHLDSDWKQRLTRDIAQAAAASLTLLATHEPDPLLPAARRVLVLREGRVAFDGTPDEFEAGRREFPELEIPSLPHRPAPAPEGPPLIELDDASITMGDRLLLGRASLRLGQGIHAIRGPNGSGKTTLLRTLMGLHPLASGSVRVAGQDPTRIGTARLSQWAAYHPEEPALMFFAPTLDEELRFGPGHQPAASCDVSARVREARSDFDLDEFAARSPLSLSGGQQERAALACLAAARTPVVLLDEPTHGLDGRARSFLHAFLHRVAARGCALIATHDPLLLGSADTVHDLRDGGLVPANPALVEAPA